MRCFGVVLSLAFVSAANAQPSDVGSAVRELSAAFEASEPELLERAVHRVMSAVNAAPDDPAALVGLSNAAHAMARLNRWQSAELLWQQVIDEGAPQLPVRPELVPLVAGAHEQLARRAEARSDWAAAADAYQVLCDSPYFARLQDPEMPKRVLRALVGAATALEQLDDHVDAARYHLRAVEQFPAELGAPERLDHAAALFARAGVWREAKSASQRLLMLYGRRQPELSARARERIERADAALGEAP